MTQTQQYFHRLVKLHQLADVLQIEPAKLAALLDRLRTLNRRKEIEASQPKSGDTTP